MRFHLKGLLVLAAVWAIVALAIDVRLGLLALVAAGLIDAVSLIIPLVPQAPDDRSRPRRS